MEIKTITNEGIERLKESKHFQNNRGYFIEEVIAESQLMQRVEGKPYWKAGDGTAAGLHIQVKQGNGGQINCSNWEELESRLGNEKSSTFIIALPKGKATLLFYITKSDFIQLVLENRELLELQNKSKSNGEGKHFRLRFSTQARKINKIKKASYREVKILNAPTW